MSVSFKAVVFKNEPKEDGSYTVYIRVGLKSKYSYIGTNLVAPKSGLNRKGKIINTIIIDKTNTLISEYRELVNSLPSLDGFTTQSIKTFILEGKSLKTPLNYSALFSQYLEENKKSPSYSIYKATLNHLTSFAGGEILVNSITPKFLKEFQLYLSSKMGDRGVQLYLSAIRSFYNEVMDDYEYKGYSFRYPFRKFSIPSSRSREVKALTKRQLVAIRDVELEGLRANRSRDLFIMSLLSLGTNAKDFYLLENIDSRITYNRSKTQNRRSDNAFFSVAVQPELLPYLEKYKGNNRALILSEWYANPPKLNEAIYQGLRQVVAQINTKHGENFVSHIEYYDARRTISSTMLNHLGIGIDVIGLCLNHVDHKNKTTWGYIERDWSVIDAANRKFIDWLFDKGQYVSVQ